MSEKGISLLQPLSHTGKTFQVFNPVPARSARPITRTIHALGGKPYMLITPGAIKELNLLHNYYLGVSRCMGFSLEVRFCVGVLQERENARNGKGAVGSGFFKICAWSLFQASAPRLRGITFKRILQSSMPT